MDPVAEEPGRAGFVLLPGFCSAGEAEKLTVEADNLILSRGGVSRGGARNILREGPAVAAWAASPVVRGLAERLLGGPAFAVRGVFFDKRPGANWKVSWHQDLTIAVRERREMPGFGPWSVKGGVPHVQPPVEILERMIAFRLHLDDCPEENGALRFLPGSHRLGRLEAGRIGELRRELPPQIRAVRRGDLLVMRPLVVHSSESSRRPGHRRVLHIEYASGALPGGLEWDLKI